VLHQKHEHSGTAGNCDVQRKSDYSPQILAEGNGPPDEGNDRKVKEMTAAVERMSARIGREWGNLVESLTKTGCLEQMQAVGIER
jgi:hypothetical protein